MAEYVDKNKIKKAITDLLERAEVAEARCKAFEKMVREYQNVIVPEYRERAEKAEHALAYLNTKAADVMPVVYGKWLCVETDDEQFFLCNICSNKEYWESNYCPNCGAKMDIEQEE